MGTNLVEERKLGSCDPATTDLMQSQVLSNPSANLENLLFQKYLTALMDAGARSGDVGRWLIFYRPSWGLIMVREANGREVSKVKPPSTSILPLCLQLFSHSNIT